MKPQDYLSRIHFEGNPSLSAESLHALQLAHMRTVPFENLDISLGRAIKLDIESLWDKIIVRKRGGFCYELNGMFAWLLKKIGFEVTYLNARVYSKKKDAFGIDFDHLALLVGVPGDPVQWLADVGFGDSFTEPLKMETSDWQDQGLHSYRVEPFQNGYQVWQKEAGGKTDRQYYFDLASHSFPFEYEAACVYHQTSPNSSFTKNRIISRATDDGRISLSDKELIITTNEGQTRIAIREDERTSLLKEYFDVVL